MQNFKLSDIDELADYKIPEMLDKEKYLAEQKQQKYYHQTHFTLKQLSHIYNHEMPQQTQRERHLRPDAEMRQHGEAFEQRKKRVGGFFSTNLVRPLQLE